MARRAAALLLALGLATPAGAAGFEGIGTLGGAHSRALGISADGAVVVGRSNLASGAIAALRWQDGVGAPLPGYPPLPSCDVEAQAASADGSRIVGLACDQVPLRWDDGAAPLSAFDPGLTQVYQVDISDDGERVVGTGLPLYLGPPTGFSATGGVTSVVSDPSACTGGATAVGSEAAAISGDGGVVVGAQWCQSTLFAFPIAGRFVTGVLEATGTLTGFAASSDGGAIVGASSGQAARWTPGEGVVPLGSFPGGSTSSTALAASADAARIVGVAQTAGGEQAFVWNAADGMRSLAAVLSDLGVDLTGWTLRRATGVSADGLTVVGWGLAPGGHEEGFVASLAPAPSVPALPPVGFGLLGAFLLGGGVLLASRLRPGRSGQARAR